MAVLRFRDRNEPRTAFVLGGGGNLGAVQIGMMRGLLDRGIRPDMLVGCSVGALNAAGLAADPSPDNIDRMEQRWVDLRSEDVFPSSKGLHGVWGLAMRGEALCSNGKLRDVIERWLPYRRFEDTAVPLHVVATSLRTGREHWFGSGPVVEPLLASAALPAILPPVRIGDEPFIDGGVVNNVPVTRAIELGATRVYVLHVGGFLRRRREQARRPLDVLIQAFSIARAHRFRSECDTAWSGVHLVTLPCIDPGTLRYNDFSHSRELIVRSHAATLEFLDGPLAQAY